MDRLTTSTPAPLEDPVGALLRLASEIAAFKEFVAGRVAELRANDWRFTDHKGAEQLRAELALYERALDRTARVLVEINRLGLEERALRNAERVTARQGEQIADVIRAILEAMLGHAERLLGDVEPWAAEQLRARWPAWIGEVVPRELTRMAEQDARRG
ncbi:hypothetical protein ACFYUV_11360 [Nonomuraea sp. NPDC003560]|uniref:hypothetical protein n=1 Tax=Nonomuraea sp. NPDC003560 TaxID=3364341 RepID=UPI00368BED52